jgi:hypothetical protein
LLGERSAMDENHFWELINLLNWKKTGNDEAVIKPVVRKLSKFEIEDIYAFEEILAQKLYELDTEAHAREIGEDAYRNDKDFFSVDSFLYSRCCVVANGKELFEVVRANPAEFPKDMEFEVLLSIAPEAYELKTGQEYDYLTSVSYETFSNKEGWSANA